MVKEERRMGFRSSSFSSLSLSSLGLTTSSLSHLPTRRPFTAQDFPIGEKPPTGYFDEDPSSAVSTIIRPQKRARTLSPPHSPPPIDDPTDLTNSDPIVDADQTRRAPSSSPANQRTKSKSGSPSSGRYEGLETELAFVREHGLAVIDDFLKAEAEGQGWATETGGDQVLADWAQSDNETDEENEWAEKKRKGEVRGERGKFDPKRWVRKNKVRLRVFSPSFSSNAADSLSLSPTRVTQGSKYVCDDPSKGSVTGPNEHVAKTVRYPFFSFFPFLLC
jgi:hypothetical protein